MAKVRLSEWKKKEVINCCDCKKLGYIEDLIIDECKGCRREENGVIFSEMGRSISFLFPALKGLVRT